MVDEESVNKARKFSAKLSNAIEGAIDQVSIKGPIHNPFIDSQKTIGEKKTKETKKEDAGDDSILAERVAILEKRVSKLERRLSQIDKNK